MIAADMLSQKSLIIYSALIFVFYKKSDENQITNSGIGFVYQQKLLLAEKFSNVEFLVPFPRLPTGLHITLNNISDQLEKSWFSYKFGCNLTYMNTSESILNYDYFAEYVQNQLQAADLDIKNLKTEISQTLAANKLNNREKRGVPLVAFGALTALTAGAGIACAVGSIFGSCGGASQNREDIDFALKNYKTMTRFGQKLRIIWMRNSS